MIKFQNYMYKISLLALSGAIFSFSSPVKAESFQDALQATLQNHPSIEAAHAARQSIKDKKAEEWSAQYPDINVTAQGGRVYGDNATSRGLSVTRGNGYSYLWEGSAGISQKIFDGFETEERIEAAEDRYKSADMDLIDVQERLALQMAQAYFDVMRTKEIIEVIHKHNAQINDYLGRIDLMVNEGAADQAELKQAEDITILLDNILTDYQSQAYNAQAMYEQLSGQAPAGQMSLPVWEHSIFPSDLESARTVLETHPSLESAEYRVAASGHDVKAEKAGFYPDVNGELFYLKKDVDDVIGGEVVDARAVIKMNWNFSTGGAQYARIRQRQANKFEAEANKRELERRLNQVLEQSWIEYETASKIMDNMSRRRQINQELFETNKNQFEGAQIRLLQLMQSENQFFQTRIEYINAKYRQKLSELGVLASLGQLQKAVHAESYDVEYIHKSPFRFDDDN